MKSTMVEFVRLFNLDSGSLRAGDLYLCTAEELPVRAFTMNMDQRPFNGWMKSMRYETASEEQRQEALQTLSLKSTELMYCASDEEGRLGSVLNEVTDELQQIDFVANAAELSAIPFEAALSSDGKPLFLSRSGIVLTRRVRGVFADEQPKWPVRPRVLFAWSSAGGAVPQDEHRQLLLEALDPWLPAREGDREKVFVEVADARLKDIKSVVDQAAESKSGFTHIHILAHGTPVRVENDDRFGVALNHVVEGVDAVKPEHLAEALTTMDSRSVVVTLAACDLANQTDSITPEKSVAHELHVAGIPVVIASQLPLTIDGSIILFRRFYRHLFAGHDVRAALHEARVDLYNSPEAGHDWVSLVGYVRLNEGYAEFLKQVALQARLDSLENLKEKVDVLEEDGAGADDFEQVRVALEREIKNLDDLLENSEGGAARDENLGLLGSAEKRMAELYFHHLEDAGEHQQTRRALERARGWYSSAFKKNRSHHWTAVQYLVLDAAITGTFDAKDWKTACYAAEVARSNEEEYWAQGSLAELALLGRVIDARTDESAETYLQEMRDRADRFGGAKGPFALRSTKQQLRRYVDWWRQDLGFFPDAPDLAPEAERLAGLL